MRLAVENGTAKPLTLEVAKMLKGQRIQVIHFGYRGQDEATDFVVGEIVSQWDLAALEKDEKLFPNGSRQTYWSTFGEEKINEFKNKLVLLDEDGKNNFIYCHSKSREFDEPTFTRSDVNRAVFFIIIEPVECLEIKSIIPGTNRVNTVLFAVSLGLISEKLPFLAERKVISIEFKKITLQANEYIDNSDLCIKEIDQVKPTDDEARLWREFYQKTTTNALPKGGVL